MKNTLRIGMIAAAMFGAAAAYADDNNHNGKPQDGYGPVGEMMMMGKKVHFQAIQAADGGHWVVISRKEAEELLGVDMGKTVFIPLK